MSEDNTGGNTGDQAGTGEEKQGFKAPADQAEFDRMVSDRISRVRAGYADHDSLKEKAAKFDQLEAEKASDIEKAKAQGKTEGITEVTATTNTRLIGYAARAVAAELKFHTPADVVGLVDFGSVTIGTNGEPDAAKIKELIEDAVKTRPYLVVGETKGQRHVRGQGARAGEGAETGVNAGRDMFVSRRKTT